MDDPLDIRLGNMHRRGRRFSRLYTIILGLSIFTQFTFAQEAKVNGHDWAYRINTGPKNKRDAQASRGRLKTLVKDPVEAPIREIPVEQGVQKDDFIVDGNTTRTHEHKLSLAVAQELFFDLRESNWEASQFSHFLRLHSLKTGEKYTAKLKTRPGLSPFDHFLEETLGWTKARCPLDYAEDCTKLPSADYIRRKYPRNRHRARQIIFVIEAQRLALEQGRMVKQVIRTAKDRLKHQCDSFAHTFFHEVTHHKRKLCPLDIANIVMAILTAMVLFLTSGFGAVFLEEIADAWGIVSTAIEALTQLVFNGGEGAITGESIDAAVAAASEAAAAAAEEAPEVAAAEAIGEAAEAAGPAAGAPVTEEVEGAGDTLDAAITANLDGSCPECTRAFFARVGGKIQGWWKAFRTQIGKWWGLSSDQIKKWWVASRDQMKKWWGASRDQVKKWWVASRDRVKKWWGASKEQLQKLRPNRNLPPPSPPPDGPSGPPPPDGPPRPPPPTPPMINEPPYDPQAVNTPGEWPATPELSPPDGPSGPPPSDGLSGPPPPDGPSGPPPSDGPSGPPPSDESTVWYTPNEWPATPELSPPDGPSGPPTPDGLSGPPTPDGPSGPPIVNEPPATPSYPRHSGPLFGTKYLRPLPKTYSWDYVPGPEEASVWNFHGVRYLPKNEIVGTPDDMLSWAPWFQNLHYQKPYLWNQWFESKMRLSDFVVKLYESGVVVYRELKARGLPQQMRRSVPVVADRAATFLEMERMQVSSFSSLATDDSSLYSQVPISRTGVLFTSINDTLNDPASAGTSGDANSTVLRATPWFSIRSLTASQMLKTNGEASKRNPVLSSAWDLGSRIQRLLVREDGTEMELEEAISFMQRNIDNIRAYGRKLERPDAEFLHEHISLPLPPSERKFEVATHTIFHPWHEYLGQLTFEGFAHPASRDGDPQLQWKVSEESSRSLPREWTAKLTSWANNSTLRQTSPNKPLEKRSAQAHSLVAQAAATHRIRGALNKMKSLGLMHPSPNRKRSNKDDDWMIDRDDDVFNVFISGKHFENDIKKQKCGKPNYSGNQTLNIEECRGVLDDVVSQITTKLDKELAEISLRKDLSNWADKLVNDFGSFESVATVMALAMHPVGPMVTAYSKMKGGLVSKAYSDQMCYVRCSKNGYVEKPAEGQPERPGDSGVVYMDEDKVVCRPGCYDVIDYRFEQLYGFKQRTADGPAKAEAQPWNYNQTRITVTSWKLYQAGSVEGFLPGFFDVDPYQDSVKAYTPILPVCSSDHLEVPMVAPRVKNLSPIPCTCGDKYGSDSEKFTSHVWGQMEPKYVSKMLNLCIKDSNMLDMATNEPAAYLVNMCRLFFFQIAPDGTPVANGDSGHFNENKRMCDKVTNWVDHFRAQGRSDAELNQGACQIWAVHAVDTSKNILWTDWTKVNQILKSKGCKGNMKHLSKDCKRTGAECPLPEGVYNPSKECIKSGKNCPKRRPDGWYDNPQ